MFNKNIKAAVAGFSAAAMLLTASSSVFAENAEAEFNVKSGETEVSSYDFEDISTYITDPKGRFLQSTVVTYKDLGGYVQLENGDRKDGANGNTGFYIDTVDSATHGKNVTAHIGQYVTANRGPKINFKVPEDITANQRLVAEFEYYPVNGTGNTADLYFRDPANSLSEIAILKVGEEIVEKQWNTIQFINDKGSYTVIANNAVISTGTMSAYVYPQLSFSQTGSEKDLQSKGTVDNVKLYTGGSFSDDDYLSMFKGTFNIDTTQSGLTTNSDGSITAKEGFVLPAASNGVSVEWSVFEANEGSEDWTAAEGIKIENNNVVIAEDIDSQGKVYKLSANLTYNSANTTKDFILKISGASDTIAAAIAATKLAYKDAPETALVPENNVYSINKDLALYKDNLVDISWSCKYADGTACSMITSEGVIMPTDYTDIIKLVATYSYKGQIETREFNVKLVNAVTEYIDPAIAALTLTSAEDATLTYPVSSIGNINTDLILPKSVACSQGKVNIEWSTESSNITIDSNNTAQILVPDFGEYEAELSAKLTYVKNNTDLVSKAIDGLKLKIVITEDYLNSDLTYIDKYTVRFDKEYAENFADIPSTASSDIKLPKEGHFGSVITWTSSAPGVISNSGKYTKPSSTKTVTLTATIMNGAASETKNFEVKVPGSSSGGGGGGGSTSSTGTNSNANSGGTIASNQIGSSATDKVTGQEKVDQLIEEKEEAENAFRDLGSVSWARDAINTLAEKGIINGKTETTFAPNDNITRAEFAKILMGVFGLTGNVYTTSSFNDVSTSDWYFASVETAYNLGIIAGTGNGFFSPDALISRQEMAVMVQRAAKVCGKTPAAIKDATVFADESYIADYAKEAVAELNAAGIISGVSELNFAPTLNATRAQAAQILYKFL